MSLLVERQFENRAGEQLGSIRLLTTVSMIRSDAFWVSECANVVLAVQDFQGDSTDSNRIGTPNFSACFGACSRLTLLLVSATSCKVEVAHRSFAMCRLCESAR
jgi:hypothetical protein